MQTLLALIIVRMWLNYSNYIMADYFHDYLHRERWPRERTDRNVF